MHKRLLPAALALLVLTGCGTKELPELTAAEPISAPAAVTEGRVPAVEYRLPETVTLLTQWQESEPVALLAEVPEKDAALYGVRNGAEGDFVLLRWGTSLAEFDWLFETPRRIQPRLWCFDVDGDGRDELVAECYQASGTGVSVYDLHVVEKNGDGTLTDYRLPESLYTEQLAELMGVFGQGGRTWVFLGEELVEITAHLPENVGTADIRGLYTGSRAAYTVDYGIEYHGSASIIAAGYYYWYVTDVTARVSYGDGVFTFSKFHLDSFYK